MAQTISKHGRTGVGVYLLMLMMGLAGCFVTIPPTVIPSPTLQPLPTVTPTANTSAWEPITPGLERRLYIPDENSTGQMMVLRIDPTRYTFRAHYRPDDPLFVQEWAEALPDAVALVNANFFDPENHVLGLLIADGVAHGIAYTDRGGLFTLENGQPRIRSSITAPYQGEPLEQAVQAFPMLVETGAQVYFNEAGDRSTRRTAIGMDTQGRVILVATPLYGLTLVELSAFLAESDLELVDAFNLDGGGSTLLWIRPLAYALASRDRVPAVLAVYPK